MSAGKFPSARHSADVILIAQHDRDLAAAIAHVLENSGRRVVVTTTVTATLDELRANSTIAVAVVDLAWPQATTEFRNQQLADPAIAAVPTLVLLSQRSDAERYAAPVLVKPFGFEELVAAIDALLERPELTRRRGSTGGE